MYNTDMFKDCGIWKTIVGSIKQVYKSEFTST